MSRCIQSRDVARLCASGLSIFVEAFSQSEILLEPLAAFYCLQGACL